MGQRPPYAAKSAAQNAVEWQRICVCDCLSVLYRACPEKDRALRVVRLVFLKVEWTFGNGPLPPMSSLGVDLEQVQVAHRLLDMILQDHRERDCALEVVRILDTGVEWQFQLGNTRPDAHYFNSGEPPPSPPQ